MNPLCPSGVPVPSTNLLRFLRQQAATLPFFTSNATSSLKTSLAQRACKWRKHNTKGVSNTPYRRNVVPSGLVSFLREKTNDGVLAAREELPRQALCSSILYFPQRSATNRAASSSRSISQRSHVRHDAHERRSRWRLWKMGRRPLNEPDRHDDLPSLGGFLDDGAGFGRILKPSTDLRLRCTELDEKGNVTLVSGEFKKSELIQKVGPSSS